MKTIMPGESTTSVAFLVYMGYINVTYLKFLIV